MKQETNTQISQTATDAAYSSPEMVVVGTVGELTGGPITVNAESYGFQAQ